MNKLKRIISAIGITAFILAWGIIGGMEQNYITFQQGALLCVVFLAITVLCVYINNTITAEYKRNREQIKHIQNDYCEYIIGMR